MTLKAIILFPKHRTVHAITSDNCICGHDLFAHRLTDPVEGVPRKISSCSVEGCTCQQWKRLTQTEELIAEVSINIDSLNELVKKASRNKQAHSTDGALSVRIKTRRKI